MTSAPVQCFKQVLFDFFSVDFYNAVNAVNKVRVSHLYTVFCLAFNFFNY